MRRTWRTVVAAIASMAAVSALAVLALRLFLAIGHPWVGFGALAFLSAAASLCFWAVLIRGSSVAPPTRRRS